MKIIKYLLAAGFALLLIILYILPTTGRANIVINVPLIHVYSQLNTPSAWRKWYAGANDSTNFQIHRQEKESFVFSTPSGSAEIRRIGALTFGVATQNSTYHISLLEQGYDRKTMVILDYETSLLSSLLPGQTDKWLKKTALYSLKDHLENPSEHYGLNFRNALTSDMHMIVYKSAVKPAEVFEAIKKAVTIIQRTVPSDDFANKDKIFVQNLPSDSGFELLVGMNVKNKPANTYPDLAYMHLYAMKSLIISYDGIYNEKNKLYTGVNNYLHDHRLRYDMPPIEIFSKDDLPSNETSRVKAEIVIPVR